MSSDVIFDGSSVTFSVKVVPRASKSELLRADDGLMRLRIASPPVDGAANDEIVRFFSKVFGVSKSSVEILSGDRSRIKCICISNASANTIGIIGDILRGR